MANTNLKLEWCPRTTVVLQEKHVDKKWITEAIRSKMRQRDSLYKRAVYEKSLGAKEYHC